MSSDIIYLLAGPALLALAMIALWAVVKWIDEFINGK